MCREIMLRGVNPLPYLRSQYATGSISPNETESLEVVLGPVRLTFDHLFERLRRECIRGLVERYRHPAPIRMIVTLVTTFLSAEGEAIFAEGANHFTSGEAAKFTVVNRHLIQ